MKIIKWHEIVEAKNNYFGEVALTIGVFDGIHIGHQSLIKEIVNNSDKLLPVMITFFPNPIQLFNTNNYAGDILSINQKYRRIESLGVHLLIMIDFSLDFSKMSAESFFKIISTAFIIKKIVVGYNFHFGREKNADVNQLTEMIKGKNSILKVIKAVKYKGEIVSSTKVRSAIVKGKIQDVKNMLADDYIVEIPDNSIKTSKDNKIVINRKSIKQALPPKGSYLCRFTAYNKKIEGTCKFNENEIICSLIPDISIKSICFIKQLGKGV